MMSNSPAAGSVLITGAHGLIGTVCSPLLTSLGYTCLTPSSAQLNITDKRQVDEWFVDHNVDAVVHLAAFTNVTEAFKQQGDRNGMAYQINVVGTKNLTAACARHSAHFIHISTSYVFDGTQPKLYTEETAPNPIEWYGQTKAEAELVVQALDTPWTILRIDAPFGQRPFAKADVAHQIIQGLQSNTLYPQFTDHFFGPTIIEDFCRVVEWVLRTRTVGLFHSSSGEQWTNFDFASLINEQLGFNRTIQPSLLDEYLAKSGNRPYQRNTALSTQKLSKLLDFTPQTVREAVSRLVI